MTPDEVEKVVKNLDQMHRNLVRDGAVINTVVERSMFSDAAYAIRSALAECDKLRSDIQVMVRKAADNKLDGYRELAKRAADAENESDRLRAARDEYHAQVRELRAENERLRAAHDQLSLYFTSGNNVPVERATILARDFWRIVGEDNTPDVA